MTWQKNLTKFFYLCCRNTTTATEQRMMTRGTSHMTTTTTTKDRSKFCSIFVCFSHASNLSPSLAFFEYKMGLRTNLCLSCYFWLLSSCQPKKIMSDPSEECRGGSSSCLVGCVGVKPVARSVKYHQLVEPGRRFQTHAVAVTLAVLIVGPHTLSALRVFFWFVCFFQNCATRTVITVAEGDTWTFLFGFLV